MIQNTQETPGLPPFMTFDQAAEHIGSTKRFIEMQVKAGKIAAFKPSFRLVRIRREEFLRWVDASSTKGGAM